MAIHFKEVCKCGAVIRQCRCLGEKVVTVLENQLCADCQTKHTIDKIKKDQQLSLFR